MAADFEDHRQKRNKENIFADYNGINITSLEKGHAVVEMEVDEKKLNPLGTVHGGCFFTIADTCAGAAATTYGKNVTTVNAEMHYLRPGRNVKKLIAENREVKVGRTLIVQDVIITDENGTELVHGTFTFFRLDDKYTEESRNPENN